MSQPEVSDQNAIHTMVCQEVHFRTSWYQRWDPLLGLAAGVYGHHRPNGVSPGGLIYHRKYWEWAAIAQALDERGMLCEGKCALGFAVGTEPLSSLFASRGVQVLATDLAVDDPGTKHWSGSNQHAAALDDLHYPHLIGNEAFRQRVTFRSIDMRKLPDLPRAQFDFVWSACALEHLGSLKAGLKFVHEATELLKPGGVGIHTTEFNVASLDRTLEDRQNVIYLRKHIEQLDADLRKNGRCLAEPDYFPGDGEHDRTYDLPPYYVSGRQHVKLKFCGHITTSIILLVLA